MHMLAASCVGHVWLPNPCGHICLACISYCACGAPHAPSQVKATCHLPPCQTLCLAKRALFILLCTRCGGWCGSDDYADVLLCSYMIYLMLLVMRGCMPRIRPFLRLCGPHKRCYASLPATAQYVSAVTHVAWPTHVSAVTQARGMAHPCTSSQSHGYWAVHQVKPTLTSICFASG
jgi:hypothetical protein